MKPEMNSQSIVEKEFAKLGMADNVVANIMSCHGGVYEMVPMEVWDENCRPEEEDDQWDGLLRDDK